MNTILYARVQCVVSRYTYILYITCFVIQYIKIIVYLIYIREYNAKKLFASFDEPHFIKYCLDFAHGVSIFYVMIFKQIP